MLTYIYTVQHLAISMRPSVIRDTNFKTKLKPILFYRNILSDYSCNTQVKNLPHHFYSLCEQSYPLNTKICVFAYIARHTHAHHIIVFSLRRETVGWKKFI